MSSEGSELDRYIKEMKRIGSDLERAMRSAGADMDRLGREALKEAAENAKKGGKEAEQSLLRLQQELKAGGPNIRKGMDDLELRMNEVATKVELEIKKRIK